MLYRFNQMDDEAPRKNTHPYYRVPFYEACQQHHRHKGDLEVTSEIRGAIGEKAQVIIVWVRGPNVENAFITHLSIKSVFNTMCRRGTPEWHLELVAPLVRGPKILVWVRALGIGNAYHPWRLRFMRLKPWASNSLWRPDSKMLKNTSIGGVS